MSLPSAIATLAYEIGSAFTALAERLSSTHGRAGLVSALGWDPAVVPLANPIGAIAGPVEAVHDAVVELENEPTLPAAVKLVESIEGAEKALRGLALPGGDYASLPEDLLSLLVVDHLIGARPTLNAFLRAFGIVRRLRVPASPGRIAHTRYELHPERIAKLLTAPGDLLQEVFGDPAGGLSTEELEDILDDLLSSVGMYASRPEMTPERIAFVEEQASPTPAARRGLRVVLVAGAQVTAGLDLISLPRKENVNAGFAIVPFVEGGATTRVQVAEDLTFTLSSAFAVDAGLALVLRPGTGIWALSGFKTPSKPASGTVTASLEYGRRDLHPMILLGEEGGSRFEVVSLAGRAGARIAGTDGEMFFEIEARQAKLVLSGSGSDGFLSTLLPKNGIEARADVTIGLSTSRGVYFQGSGALSIALPLQLDLGPISVRGMSISVQPTPSALELRLRADVGTKLGPLSLTVTGLGAKLALTTEGASHNLGPFQATPGLVPPDGIGVVLKGGGFEGGGFLRFEHERHRYSGALQLDFKGLFAIRALGVLDTELPGGGYSLLFLLTIELGPIPLGFGFSLEALGGMLGLHRGMSSDAVRAGVTDGSLSSVLFPTDVVANADRIIRDLDKLFPVSQGRFVFGPMALIAWGSPALVHIELGLLIEVPEPPKIAIVGRLRAALPTEDAALVVIQASFVGMLDFEQKLLSFDASLAGSRILAFTLDGGIALRVGWGDKPGFLLSVGGFHPAYKPPPELKVPPLARLSVSLLGGDNPRVRLSTYLAITSNTVQLGAAVELYAGISKFNVYGFLSFDALVQFQPFHFEAQFGAMLAVRWGETVLFGVSLDLLLAGPAPWHVAGTATFKIWFIKFSVSFDETWGDPDPTSLPVVDVPALVAEGFAEQRAWEPVGLPGSMPAVTLREGAREGGLVLDPFGGLRIRQTKAPLGVAVQHVGAARAAGGSVTVPVPKVELGGVEVQPSAQTRDEFAIAQYRDMSDAEKLGAPDFEPLVSGIELSDPTRVSVGTARTRTLNYEHVVLGRAGNRLSKRLAIGGTDLLRSVQRGAAARSAPAERLGVRRVDTGAGLLPERFILASRGTLEPHGAARSFTTRVEAEEHLRSLPRTTRALYQVLPAGESEPK